MFGSEAFRWEKLRNNSSVEYFIISDNRLCEMVRKVSEDKLYDTIEFNEFLQMMSKQEEEEVSEESLMEAFK